MSIDPIRIDAARLDRSDKAQAIYQQAQSALLSRLWQAALGTPAEVGEPMPARPGAPLNLLALIGEAAPAETPAPPPAATSGLDDASLSLGPNARFAPALSAAAQRSGIPAAALAAIIDAEAAKGADGSWNVRSRNPRSSAMGLTQFLAGTWESEAERSGTFLNRVAQDNGWLDPQGRIRADRREALLSLRADPRCAIEAAADYASANLARLRSAGIEIGSDSSRIAQLAYLSHHLGPGDALAFLKGAIAPDRARRLLAAQLGATEAERRIALTGSPVQAHRQWLAAYVDRRIVPERFLA